MIETHEIFLHTDRVELAIIAQFEIATETYSGDRMSWGIGNDVSATVELVTFHIGNWVGTRTDALAMFGADQIAQREADIAERAVYEAAA